MFNASSTSFCKLFEAILFFRTKHGHGDMVPGKKVAHQCTILTVQYICFQSSLPLYGRNIAQKSWHLFLVPTTLPGEQWREGNHSGSGYWEGEILRNKSSIDEDGMEERIFDLCFLLGSLFDCCMMVIYRMAFECTTDGWTE